MVYPVRVVQRSHGPAEVVVLILEAGFKPVDGPLDDVGGASDCTYGAVDFVGYSGNELADGGHFLRLDELSLRLLQLGDRLLELAIFLAEISRAFRHPALKPLIGLLELPVFLLEFK